MKLLEEIQLDFAKVSLLESGIICCEMFEFAVIGASEAKAMNDAIGVLSNYEPALILIKGGLTVQIEKGAREFSASDEGLAYTKADALVVRSLAQRLIATFYLRINKPKKPSRLFETEGEAISWLQSI